MNGHEAAIKCKNEGGFGLFAEGRAHWSDGAFRWEDTHVTVSSPTLAWEGWAYQPEPLPEPEPPEGCELVPLEVDEDGSAWIRGVPPYAWKAVNAARFRGFRFKEEDGVPYYRIDTWIEATCIGGYFTTADIDPSKPTRIATHGVLAEE